MPRNTNISAHDKYNSPFPTRLRALLTERGTTQDELAAVLSVKRQTIGRYTDGSASPSYDSLVTIARFFGVTTDYMVGASDVPSTDATVQGTAEITGLSQKAIETLFTLRKSSEIRSLSQMMESPLFLDLIEDIRSLSAISKGESVLYRAFLRTYTDVLRLDIDDGLREKAQKEVADHITFQAQKKFLAICEEVAKHGAEKQ